MRAAEETLADLFAKGHQRDAIPRMLTRKVLYERIDYAGYEERDRGYVAGE
jgi:2-methylisocitrate lyase-like PEP mutase family enzyme